MASGVERRPYAQEFSLQGENKERKKPHLAHCKELGVAGIASTRQEGTSDKVAESHNNQSLEGPER